MDRRYKKIDQAYISGNNAIQLERNYSNYKERVKKTSKRKKPIHEKTNPFYTFILFLVIIATLGISVLLLKTQFTVSDVAGDIIKMQNDLVEIKKKNAQIKSEIQQSTNMDEIYEIATKELGMVQASKGDIEYIEAKDITYTIQFAELENNMDKSPLSISNILTFISKGW